MMGRVSKRLARAGLAVLALAAPGVVGARDVLGVFERWGAFRDPQTARCFAIAQPIGQASAAARWRPFAAVGYWPRQGVRGQVNIRLSHELAPGAEATLAIAEQRFALAGGGGDVWARDRQGDAAIVAALRTGGTMSVHGRAKGGVPFTDRYELRGAATAIDAAALGCARLR